MRFFWAKEFPLLLPLMFTYDRERALRSLPFLTSLVWEDINENGVKLTYNTKDEKYYFFSIFVKLRSLCLDQSIKKKMLRYSQKCL